MTMGLIGQRCHTSSDMCQGQQIHCCWLLACLLTASNNYLMVGKQGRRISSLPVTQLGTTHQQPQHVTVAR